MAEVVGLTDKSSKSPTWRFGILDPTRRPISMTANIIFLRAGCASALMKRRNNVKYLAAVQLLDTRNCLYVVASLERCLGTRLQIMHRLWHGSYRPRVRYILRPPRSCSTLSCLQTRHQRCILICRALVAQQTDQDMPRICRSNFLQEGRYG